MKRLRHRTGKLVLALTLVVAALLLPSSPARAWQGHGGGHAGRGGSGHPAHHGHRPFSGGFVGTWGGYDPYWGYDPFYGGPYGYGIGSYGYGIYDGNNPYLGVINPYSGFSPFPPAGTYSNYNFINAIDLFR